MMEMRKKEWLALLAVVLVIGGVWVWSVGYVPEIGKFFAAGGVPTPVLDTLSPSFGMVGTEVTLHGSNFPGQATILFGNGQLQPTHVDGNTMRFTVPAELFGYCAPGAYCAQYLAPIQPGDYSVAVFAPELCTTPQAIPGRVVADQPLECTNAKSNELIFTVKPTIGAKYFQYKSGSESFMVKMTNPATIQQALDDLQGQRHLIVSGIVNSGNGGFNSPWSWHLDPATIVLGELFTEVCDATPSYVETHLEGPEGWLGQRYCPWGAKVNAVYDTPPPPAAAYRGVMLGLGTPPQGVIVGTEVGIPLSIGYGFGPQPANPYFVTGVTTTLLIHTGAGTFVRYDNSTPLPDMIHPTAISADGQSVTLALGSGADSQGVRIGNTPIGAVWVRPNGPGRLCVAVNRLQTDITAKGIRDDVFDINNIGGGSSESCVDVVEASHSITSSLEGDADGNGTVNIFDYNTLVSHFGQSGLADGSGDLDGDGDVDIFDYNILVSNFGH